MYCSIHYQEQYDPENRWTDRIIFSSGDRSENVYDFYFHVYNKLQQDIKVPFKMEGTYRVDDTPVHQAPREDLANRPVNADYYGRRGVVIIKKKDCITTEHPKGKTSQIAEFIELKKSRTRDYFKKLTEDGTIEMSGSNRNRVYRLKR